MLDANNHADNHADAPAGSCEPTSVRPMTQVIRYTEAADDGIMADLYRDAVVYLHKECDVSEEFTASEPQIPERFRSLYMESISCGSCADTIPSWSAYRSIRSNAPVTTRRAAIQRASLKRLRAILDAIPAFIGLCEPTGHMIEVNKTVLDSTDLARDYYTGKLIWALHAFTHSPQSIIAMRSNLALASEGKSVKFQTRARTLRSELIPIEVSFVPLLHPEKNSPYILAFALDISERLDFESRLQETIAHLREAQHLGQTGSWTWDLTTGKIYWSDETFRLFGIPPQIVEPEFEAHFMRSVVAEDRMIAREAIGATVENPSRPLRMEIRVNSADGAIRVLQVRGTAHCDRNGNVTRMTGTAQDVTESRALQKDRDILLGRLNRAAHWASLGEMAAGIAHEINQPLAAIQLYAEGCREQLLGASPEGSFLASQLEEISRLADRCGKIVQRTKDFTNNRQSRPETIPVVELFNSVCDLLGNEIREKHCEVISQCESPELRIRGDRIQLQQAMTNMIRNSLEAMEGIERDRRIHISGRYDGDQWVTLAVRDLGPGVPSELHEQIFTPFFTTKPGGMGLGLRVCCKIAESHGGYLCYRTPPHRGAEFALTIPSIPPENPVSAGPRP